MMVPLMTHVVKAQKAGDISYLEAGDRNATTTLVMLHGIGSNASSFSRLMPMAADWCRVIAWDAPGYGDSKPLADEWPDAGDYAAALTGFLDNIGCDRVVLIGHSLGALVAARFAATKADRVSVLVLLSPACGYGVEKGAALPAAQQARIDELEAIGGRDFARRRAPRLVHRAGARPEAYAAVERAMSQVKLPGYAQAVRLLAGGDIFRDVPALGALPVMVGVGDQDAVVAPEKAKALFDALDTQTGATRQFALFSDCGHALPQEKPAMLWEELSGFIAIHDDAGSTADVR